MKLIPLSQGLYAQVDDLDYKWLSCRKWTVKRNRSIHYAFRQVQTGPKRHATVYMHREITLARPGQQVDHVSGNGLNNQRSNLRLCTHAQNLRNQRAQAGRSSKYKGVSWLKARKKWEAYIKVNRVKHHLGRFEDEIEAAKAYDSAAIKFFGEFARLNFP